MDKAQSVTKQIETLHVLMTGAKALISALENPAKANNKLLKAVPNNP